VYYLECVSCIILCVFINAAPFHGFLYFFVLSIIFYTQLKHYFLLKEFCDTHLIYSYILTPQPCVNLMQLHTRVRNFFVVVVPCHITEVKQQTNKKQLCLIQLDNQIFYDTLDTNRCSIDILPMNE